MFHEDLKIAYTKSDEICQLLNYRSDRMISTQEVVDVVKEKYCNDIRIQFHPFDDLDVGCKYGAMMRTVLDENNNVTSAIIIINSSKDPKFQRFSLLHELGHLVTGTSTTAPQSDKGIQFALSTHIDFKITNIKDEEIEKSRYLLNEQIANIFALRVLMPGEQFYEKLATESDISEIADFFGLTKEAVVSRAQIGR